MGCTTNSWMNCLVAVTMLVQSYWVCGTGKEKQREKIVDNVKRQAKRKKVDDDDDGIDEALRESIIEMGKCLFSYQILMTE